MMMAQLVIKERVKINHGYQSIEGFLSQTSGKLGFPDIAVSPGPEHRLGIFAESYNY